MSQVYIDTPTSFEPDMVGEFKDFDKDNKLDSWGYELVDEDDVIESVYSEEKGIMLYGIYYSG